MASWSLLNGAATNVRIVEAFDSVVNELATAHQVVTSSIKGGTIRQTRSSRQFGRYGAT